MINVPIGQLAVGVSTSIANGQTDSAVIPLNGMSLVGISTPAALTGTSISFLACDTADGTFLPLKSTASGTLFSLTVAASGYYSVDPALFAGVAFLKIKSGSSEAALRTLKLSLKGI